MPDGNVATATTEQQTIQNDQTSPTGSNEGQSDGEKGSQSLEAQVAVLKEQYSQSSKEGHRLYEEKKALETRLANLEGSLIKQQENKAQSDNQFPPEESYIKFAVENADKTEKEARMEYREKKLFWDNQQTLQTTMQALINKQRFDSELSEKSYIDNTPEAKEAVEQFKGIPELESLPTVEKVQRYRELRTRLGVPSKVEGRDMSRVKMAASGTGAGISGATTFETPNADKDAAARSAGFPSWKAAQEMQQCKTAAQALAVKQKYKMK